MTDPKDSVRSVFYPSVVVIATHHANEVPQPTQVVPRGEEANVRLTVRPGGRDAGKEEQGVGETGRKK